MQCHYHWLRLTLEILAALHVPRDSEIWIWGLQLKLLPVVRHRKSPECAWVLLALIRHCPLELFSLQGTWAPKPCGTPGTFTGSKQFVVVIIKRLLVYLSITAWILAHSWICCPEQSPFSLSAVSVNISPHKAGTEGAVLAWLSGMFQGFMCCHAWFSLVRPNSM